MCVLYVSFGSKVRPRTFGCIDCHGKCSVNFNFGVQIVLIFHRIWSEQSASCFVRI